MEKSILLDYKEHKVYSVRVFRANIHELSAVKIDQTTAALS